MPHDIYTKKLIVTQSDEHILPCSLGGRLVGRHLIDQTTNSEFGKGIDARLDEAVRGIRNMIGARNCKGEPPHPLRVRGEDGNEYMMESGGKLRPAPSGSLEKLDNGEMRFQATVTDARELERLLRKKLRRVKPDANVKAVVAKAIAEAVDRKLPTPGASFNLPLLDRDPYRATAKMAFNFLALNDAELALSGAFDPIREFICSGTSLPTSPVQGCTTPNSDDPLGVLDHLVVVEVRASGEVVASVTYFGHVTLVIRLGQVQECQPRRWTYRVDQLNSVDRRDHPADMQIPIPSFSVAVSDTFEVFVARSLEQMRLLASKAQTIQHSNFVMGVAMPHMTTLASAFGDEEKTRAAVEVIVTNIISEMRPNLERDGESVSDAEAQYRALLLGVLGLSPSIKRSGNA